MRFSFLLSALAAGLLGHAGSARAAEADLVIYGGTSAGVGAAIQAARMGKSSVIIEPSRHVGGLTTGGLGWTDSGNKAVVGGIAREFYQKLKKHYDDPKNWTFGKRDDYKFYRANEDAIWAFEPHVAEAILKDWLKEHKVEVVYGERLDRTPGKGVKQDGKRITALVTESGKTFSGKVFIDATYEGDLMAAAGVSYTAGREANAKYGETLNGVQPKLNTHLHRFVVKVDPYVTPGDPKSGLLPLVEAGPLPADGTGDNRVQTYCYRMCMSLDPNNRVPFPKPDGYDERQHELLLRNFEAGDLRLPLKPDMMPNGKTDTNNNCAVSTDHIGANTAYPEASYAEREKILADHKTYQQGLMWTLANHPRVPEKVRKDMAKWGLAKNEFTDNGHWPHQIYVREARRMLGDYVHTEQDCRRLKETPQSVGMGSYNMDSHNCVRYVTAEGGVQNEGDIQQSPGGPYRISYRSIVPKKAECPNLLVPVCVSSSHIAYGSIRMEPVFFVLGQSAATAAVFAIDDKQAVQDVPYDKLQKRLLEDKQVLQYAAAPLPAGKGGRGPIDASKLAGIVVDDEAAERVGFEGTSSARPPFVGVGYHHDNGMNRGKQRATFQPELPATGTYEVRMSFPADRNRSSKVAVTVVHADGKADVVVNQQKAPPVDGVWLSLGQFRFEKGKAGHVEIRNDEADGHVILDAVQWLPKE